MACNEPMGRRVALLRISNASGTRKRLAVMEGMSWGDVLEKVKAKLQLSRVDRVVDATGAEVEAVCELLEEDDLQCEGPAAHTAPSSTDKTATAPATAASASSQPTGRYRQTVDAGTGAGGGAAAAAITACTPPAAYSSDPLVYQRLLGELRARLSARDTLVVAESLRKILGSIREHPDKERFRSLNLESKAFHSRVGRHALAVRFLEACGFQHDGTRLVLTAAAARGLPFTALENALNATTVWAEVRGGRGSFVDPAGQRKAAPPALLQGDEAKDGGGGGANSASTDDETALRRLRADISARAQHASHPARNVKAYADIATRNRAVRRARRQERGAAPLEDHASAGASKSDEEDVGTAPANAAEERLVQQMLVTRLRESRMSPARREYDSLQKKLRHDVAEVVAVFSDGTCINAAFSPFESVADVLSVLQGCLREQYQQHKLSLQSWSGHDVLRPTELLIDVGVVPSGALVVKAPSTLPAARQALQPQLLQPSE